MAERYGCYDRDYHAIFLLDAGGNLVCHRVEYPWFDSNNHDVGTAGSLGVVGSGVRAAEMTPSVCRVLLCYGWKYIYCCFEQSRFEPMPGLLHHPCCRLL